MHQLIHCHTLLQPFSKIFLFRIYVPTTYTPAMLDFDLDETSVSGIHKYTHPYNPQTNPPTTTDTHPYTHKHTPTDTTSIQPHKRTTATPTQTNPPTTPSTQPHTTDTTFHKYHNHTASTNTYSPTNTQRHKHPLDAAQAPVDVDVDVDADDVPTLMQHRCRHSPDALAATHQSAIGQARQTGSD